MDTPPSSMRDLARRLLALEAASPSASGPHVHEAVRVCEKLRITLTRFAGADGFTSLMRRALALARAEVPSMGSISVKADRPLEGLEELVAHARKSWDGGAEAVTAIMTHLLGLLFTFIGEPLTLTLLREAWPDTALDEQQPIRETP
jgi:hypothetical protein